METGRLVKGKQKAGKMPNRSQKQRVQLVDKA
jgi:hypothetical protein